MIYIVPCYASCFGFIFVFLSVLVIRRRRRSKLAIGINGNPELERAVRVHGNFGEYVPLVVILLAFLETTNFPHWALHILCITVLVGRCSHAYGVLQISENFFWRVFGVACTLTTIVIASIFNLLYRL